MLTLHQASLSQGSKRLLEKTSYSLFQKQKVGLIGKNGCGKSSFFSLINQDLALDHGEFHMNQHIKISHLAQILPEGEETALNYVLAGDKEYFSILNELKLAEETGQDAQVLIYHNRLNEMGGYQKPALAAQILSGLGFKENEHTQPVSCFSGGWRMRLNLARCLMSPADLYLLDEPTNHLDMEAIFWLERWLKQVSASLLIISHDRDFLDGIVTHILHIENYELNLYKGNYSQFEKTRAEKIELQKKQYEKQQKKVSHLMTYVERFRAKASKAKQAQSRLKAIEKIDVIAKAQMDSGFSFSFLPCETAGKPLLECEKVSLGYSSAKPILKNIQLSINPGDRLALLGPNGEGKSTLMKGLTGTLDPVSGRVIHNKKLSYGYFAQHQVEDLNLSLSPYQIIQQIYPSAKEQDIRNFLGGFGFCGDMALSSIRHFSGGEKARLALAKLVWAKPNLILLDEPTNHLDIEMRAALELALMNYEGAVVLVSHDRHLLDSSIDGFYLVADQKAVFFEGCLDDYKQWVLDRQQTNEKLDSNKKSDHKARKILVNKIKNLERIQEKIQEDLVLIESELANPELYEKNKLSEVDRHTQNRAQLTQKLNAVEAEWFELMEQLES